MITGLVAARLRHDRARRATTSPTCRCTAARGSASATCRRKPRSSAASTSSRTSAPCSRWSSPIARAARADARRPARRILDHPSAPHAGAGAVGRRAPPRRDRARAGHAAALHPARRAVRRHRPDRGRRHPRSGAASQGSRHRRADHRPQRARDARHHRPRLHPPRRPGADGRHAGATSSRTRTCAGSISANGSSLYGSSAHGRSRPASGPAPVPVAGDDAAVAAGDQAAAAVESRGHRICRGGARAATRCSSATTARSSRSGAEPERNAGEGDANGNGAAEPQLLDPVDGRAKDASETPLDTDFGNVWSEEGGDGAQFADWRGSGGRVDFDDSEVGLDQTLSRDMSLRDHLLAQLNVERQRSRSTA